MLTPLPSVKWTYRTAAHLLNRGGFGGTPVEIEKLASLGMEKAVATLVDFEKIPDQATAPEWANKDTLLSRNDSFMELQGLLRAAKTDEERSSLESRRRERFQIEQREEQRHTMELRGWWLERMAKGPRPLQEKMTLFWHGHFATSAQKVRTAYFMYLQNETFRRYGMGNWLDLLEAVTKDPAMLIWLDQAQSRKEHPNENYAREVMELFTLGEGNYTEKDVTEAARAFTGYTLDRPRGEFVFRPFMHDEGEKTVLGKTGDLGGMDVLDQIVAQPQAAKFICTKLWKFFASENVEEPIVDALAEVFRRNGNNFKPLLRAMFSAEAFYADEVVNNQVKSPTQWLVGSVRLLERDLPEPLVSASMMRQIGQELFLPPNVKGWDGGLSWITTNNLFTRYNLAATLVLAQVPTGGGEAQRGIGKMVEERVKRLAAQMPVVDVRKIFNEHERLDKAAVIPALEKRFLCGGALKEKQRQVLRDYLDSRGELDDDDIRHAIRLVMSTPEYQLA